MMDSLPQEVPAEYSKTTRRNCSLTARGRLFFLALISTNVLIIAVLSALAGAWLVLPFAGMEIAAVALAFRFIGLRDGDFERLTILGERVLVEVSERGRLRRVEFNRAWATVVRRPTAHGCRLAIRSHGRELVIGQLMSDDERRDWSRELQHRIRTVRQ